MEPAWPSKMQGPALTIEMLPEIRAGDTCAQMAKAIKACAKAGGRER